MVAQVFWLRPDTPSFELLAFPHTGFVCCWDGWKAAGLGWLPVSVTSLSLQWMLFSWWGLHRWKSLAASVPDYVPLFLTPCLSSWTSFFLSLLDTADSQHSVRMGSSFNFKPFCLTLCPSDRDTEFQQLTGPFDKSCWYCRLQGYFLLLSLVNVRGPLC